MPKQLVLDTNLTVLLCIGLTNRSYVTKHKRLKEYTEADFDLLQHLISQFDTVVFSPNIMTETSNLLRQSSGPMKKELSKSLKDVSARAFETYVETSRAVEADEYEWLGVTDSVALLMLNKSRTLLTADHNLHVAALRRGLTSENFNHYRQL